MAGEWDALHRLYSKRLSTSSSAAAQGRKSKELFSERISRQLGENVMVGSRPRSGSLKNSFASSLGSNSSAQDTPLARDVRSHSSPAPPRLPAKPGKQYYQEEDVPVYINVHRKPEGMTDAEDPDDFVDPEFFKSKEREETDEGEGSEEVVMQAWSDDGSRAVECDEEQCRLVDRNDPSTQPSLYELKLQGEPNYVNHEKPQQVNWEVASTGDEGMPTGPTLHAGGAGGYPPGYDECTVNSTQYEDGTDQLTACNIDIPRNADSEEEDDEEETETSLRQHHFYKNIPLLIPQGNVQSESSKQRGGDGGQDDHTQQPSNRIYSNMVVINQTATPSSTGSSPPKQNTVKPAKKPMPIQRKKTKSEDLLEEELASTVVEVSSDLTASIELHAAPSGKASVMGSPSAGKKKPPPPAKPAKLSLYIDGSAKRPMIPTVKKGGGKLGVAGSGGRDDNKDARPHSSSMSDEGEVFLSEEHSLPPTKPRSYTHASVDLKSQRHPPLVLSGAVSSTTATATKATSASKLSNASVNSVETDYREAAEVAEEQQSGLKVCGILVSPSEEEPSLCLEEECPISEDRPPSPLAPPPPSSSLVQHPATNLDPEPQNETRTATKVRNPFKSPRFGSVKKNTASSSKPSGAGASVEEKGPSGRDELMRKLSQRRMKIEEQITVKTGTGSGSSLDSSSMRTSETGSPMLPYDTHSLLSEDSEGKRSSLISSSSNNSEVVVAYHAKNGGKNFHSHASPSNGLAKDNMNASDRGVVQRRDGKASEEDGSLAKYGIIEDVAGGSYII